MTDMNTTTAAQVDASTRAKVRRAPIERFPERLHCAITTPMAQSLRRITGGNSLASESHVVRMALHHFMLTNDPIYLRTMQGQANG
jgi:hypothetical protein